MMQFEAIHPYMCDVVYTIQPPEQIIFDLDSTNFETYGKQEGNSFNYHYSSFGYHPLLCYDGLTGDLLKYQLRNGSIYTSNKVVNFLCPLIKEYKQAKLQYMYIKTFGHKCWYITWYMI